MTATKNQFQFWRVLVALAHQDHKITGEERDFITSKFDYIDFSPEQKAQLLDELNTAQDAMALFDSLEDNIQRAECLHMAHTLFGADHDYSPVEEKMYERLKQKHMGHLDKTAIMADYKDFLAKQEAKDTAFEHELETLRDRYDFLSGWKRFFS